MTEDYIRYWGLERHPFLLAPDSAMMYVAGQYYECLERLKYAINTNKGGVLLISEDAGLGKTTIILKLIDDMRKEHGDSFRYAIVENPTLTIAQIIASITGDLTGVDVGDDKLKNLQALKESLIRVKEQGGKSIIVIDEGQMLCEMKDVLQELRVLINLTHKSEYLHTFILSGQRILWTTIREMPEFWQRLPVKYYLVPLQMEETKELVRFRLAKAGLEPGREIFTEDALEIVHRYAHGAPRTIIALSDLALLIGYTSRVDRITFKEVSKAMHSMSGRGESLPYMAHGNAAAGDQAHRERQNKSEERTEAKKERVVPPGEPSIVPGPAERDRERKTIPRAAEMIQGPPVKARALAWKPVYSKALLYTLLLAGGVGYYFTFAGIFKEYRGTPRQGSAVQKVPEKAVLEGHSPESAAAAPAAVPVAETIKEEKASPVNRPEAVVSVERANVREGPDLEAPVLTIVEKGLKAEIEDETLDESGQKWYKVALSQNLRGWMSHRVLIVVKERDVWPVKDRKETPSIP
jgi:type II secretory pathway predicted ATPase ExeA